MGNLFAAPPHAFDKTKTSLKSISSHKTRVAQLAAIADDLDRRGAPRPAAYRWKDQPTSPTASRHMKRRAGPTRKVLYLVRHGEATHNAAVIAATNRGESKRTVYDSEAYASASGGLDLDRQSKGRGDAAAARRGSFVETSRGGDAAATWIVRGDGSRRRRGGETWIVFGPSAPGTGTRP